MISHSAEAPKDFDVFRDFKGAKDYLGLIYADANNIGRAIEEYSTLPTRREFAGWIDDALYTAICTAINSHLQVDALLKPLAQQRSNNSEHVFPFDILLLGGDDICMVVPAAVAFDVALTLAETFRTETREKHSLSVGSCSRSDQVSLWLCARTCRDDIEVCEEGWGRCSRTSKTRREELSTIRVSIF